MILNGDEVMKNTVHLQLSKERHIKKSKKRSFGRGTLSYNLRDRESSSIISIEKIIDYHDVGEYAAILVSL